MIQVFNYDIFTSNLNIFIYDFNKNLFSNNKIEKRIISFLLSVDDELNPFNSNSLYNKYDIIDLVKIPNFINLFYRLNIELGSNYTLLKKDDKYDLIPFIKSYCLFTISKILIKCNINDFLINFGGDIIIRNGISPLLNDIDICNEFGKKLPIKYPINRKSDSIVNINLCSSSNLSSKRGKHIIKLNEVQDRKCDFITNVIYSSTLLSFPFLCNYNSIKYISNEKLIFNDKIRKNFMKFYDSSGFEVNCEI